MQNINVKEFFFKLLSTNWSTKRT